MSEKKPKYETETPRPEDIKVTAKSPTVEQLKEYRAAWLKEGEESGIIDDLFLIVKTFGKFPEWKSPFPGWPTLRRFEFTDGDCDYVIFLDRTIWETPGKTIIPWEEILVVENGEHKRERVTGKKLVSYYRRLELSPAEKHAPTPVSDGAKIEANFYVPGYWTGMIGEFAKDAKHELGKASAGKAQDERAQLLNTLNLS